MPIYFGLSFFFNLARLYLLMFCFNCHVLFLNWVVVVLTFYAILVICEVLASVLYLPLVNNFTISILFSCPETGWGALELPSFKGLVGFTFNVTDYNADLISSFTFPKICHISLPRCLLTHLYSLCLKLKFIVFPSQIFISFINKSKMV